MRNTKSTNAKTITGKTKAERSQTERTKNPKTGNAKAARAKPAKKAKPKTQITGTPYDDVFHTLLLLIPFYIFTHEKRFRKYKKGSAGLAALQAEYAQIRERLEELTARGAISEYTKCTITDMSKKVMENIAKKHDSVREGVENVMGGKVLEYEAKTILKKGIAQGEKQGLEQGLEQGEELKLIQLVQKKLKKHKTEEQIAEDLEETIENITQICKAIQRCKSENPQEIYQVLKTCQQ